MKVDPLSMEFESNRTWFEDNPDTLFVRMNGALYQVTSRIDKIMAPFYECLAWGLTFISFLIWIVVIAFFLLVFALLIVAIVGGLLGFI